jgi:transcription termination factor NusB
MITSEQKIAHSSVNQNLEHIRKALPATSFDDPDVNSIIIVSDEMGDNTTSVAVSMSLSVTRKEAHQLLEILSHLCNKLCDIIVHEALTELIGELDGKKAYDDMTPVERAMFAKAAHEQFINQESAAMAAKSAMDLAKQH